MIRLIVRSSEPATHVEPASNRLKTGPTWVGWFALGAACAAAAAGCRTRQELSYGIKTVDFTNFRGHADLIVRRQEREQESKTGPSVIRSKETTIEESLSLKTDGYVLHPNILEFGLGAVFGLLQEDFEDVIDGRKRSSSHRGDLLEFDLNAQFLRRRPYPVTVFAHRQRGLVPRPFLPSLETTTTSYGLTWQYISKKTPTSLRFSHTDARLTPLLVSRTGEEEGRQKSTELRFETGYHFSDDHALSFLYEHESVSEAPFELDYDSDEVTFTHRLDFGGDRRHRLRSELSFLNQRGTIGIEEIRWRSDLRLKHSDSLESSVRFDAIDRSRGNRSSDVPDVEERSYHLSWSLRHQLYQSQTVQLRAFVQKQEFAPKLEVSRWGGEAILNYRKTNRWGVLNVNLGLRAEQNESRGAAQAAEIIDEAHTFRDPDPITLGSRNVNTGSITIRSQDRVTFYRRGRDFTVLTVGDLIEIRRVPTGRIADGETVLIGYTFNLGGDFELDTVSYRFGVRQDFEFGLTPYYRFEWQDQSLSPPSASGAIEEDITAHIVGVEYRRSTLRLFAEYEDNDSTIIPFTSLRLGAYYTHRFRSGAETILGVRWTDTRHRVPNERFIKLLTLEGRHRHPITRDLTLESSVLYRNGEDTFSDDTEGIDVSLTVEWLIRETKITMSLEHSEFEDRFARNDNTGLFFHLRRGF